MLLEILKRKASDNCNRTQSLTKEVSTESVTIKKVSKLLNTVKNSMENIMNLIIRKHIKSDGIEFIKLIRMKKGREKVLHNRTTEESYLDQIEIRMNKFLLY
jgi:hypothetical protein